jgi:hypothetical protein
MMAELARFGVGRVLLHLIAMLGDGAFRFHAAGIMREVTWVAGATTFLTRARTHLIGAPALYLAQPVRHYRRLPPGVGS